MNQYRGKHTSTAQWPVGTARSRRRGRHQIRNRKRRALGIVICAVIVITLAYLLINPHFSETDRKSLLSEDLPSDIGHLHIVYISDIHYGFSCTDLDLNRLANQINNLKPDIILFGGDYATDNPTAIRFFEKLPSLHARYAILGVVGETDRGETDMDLTLLTDAMRDANVTPLVNNVFPVRMGNRTVYVAGIDEPQKGDPALKDIASSVSAEDYVILLGHNPSVIPESQRITDKNGKLGWFDLALFGHTHGGQIPLLAPLLDIAGDVPERYRQGWFSENRASILVSNGVGTSVIPVRAFCPAQIHYIDVAYDGSRR